MLHDRDIETLIDIAEAARLVIDFVTVHGPGNRQKVFLWADDNSLRA